MIFAAGNWNDVRRICRIEEEEEVVVAVDVVDDVIRKHVAIGRGEDKASNSSSSRESTTDWFRREIMQIMQCWGQ